LFGSNLGPNASLAPAIKPPDAALSANERRQLYMENSRARVARKGFA